MIRERLPATPLLAVAALCLAIAGGDPARGGGRAPAALGASIGVARVASLVGVAVPSFVLGPVLVLVFAIGLGWLPDLRQRRARVPRAARGDARARHGRGPRTRLTRAAMLEVLGPDHLRTARAKGAGPMRRRRARAPHRRCRRS